MNNAGMETVEREETAEQKNDDRKLEERLRIKEKWNWVMPSWNGIELQEKKRKKHWIKQEEDEEEDGDTDEAG